MQLWQLVQGGGITPFSHPQEHPFLPGLRELSVDEVDVYRGGLSSPAWPGGLCRRVSRAAKGSLNSLDPAYVQELEEKMRVF